MKFLANIDNASKVVTDELHRFVTDEQISDWDSKAEGIHNHDGVYVRKGEIENATTQKAGIVKVSDSSDTVVGQEEFNFFSQSINEMIGRKADYEALVEYNSKITELTNGLRDKADLDHSHDGTYARLDSMPKASQSEAGVVKLNDNSDIAVGVLEFNDYSQGIVEQLNKKANTSDIQGSLDKINSFDEQLGHKADAEHNHDGRYIKTGELPKATDEQYGIVKLTLASDEVYSPTTTVPTASALASSLENHAERTDNIINTKVKTNVPENAKFTDTTYSAGSGIEIDESNVISATLTKQNMGLSNVDNKSSSQIRDEITKANITNGLGFTPIDSALKGVNNGLAELDSQGKIPASQLPSYVDDVLEYSSKSSFPSVGETGKIYTSTDNNKIYRWSGTGYVEISSSITLGETSSTAYRGDRGKIAYDHSQSPHNYEPKNSNIQRHISSKNNPHNVTKSEVGLGNVNNTSDLDKPISTAMQSALDDKVNKVSGKGLSTNDYTNTDKAKVNKIDSKIDSSTAESLINSKINEKVKTNVPSNAKFTDTIQVVTKEGITESSTPSSFTDPITVTNFSARSTFPTVDAFGGVITISPEVTPKRPIQIIVDSNGEISYRRGNGAHWYPWGSSKNKVEKSYVDNRVKVPVPSNAKFTDTITTNIVTSKSEPSLQSKDEWHKDTTNVGLDDKSNSPGPKKLKAGTMQAGYFGIVPSSALFTNREISNSVGITEGTLVEKDIGWLKLACDGRVIFKCLGHARGGVSWNTINSAGAVSGSKRVSKNGVNYQVTLLNGGAGTPVDDDDPEPDMKISEWNKLILPLSIEAKTQDWKNPYLVSVPSEYWGTDFLKTDLLGMNKYNQLMYEWCKETSKSGAQAILRGEEDIEHGDLDDKASAHGWSPVLRVV